MSRLEASFSGYYETTTDDVGRYEFDGVDAHIGSLGAARIRAVHQVAGASIIADLPAGDATVDLVILESGEIRGTVIGPGGLGAIVCATRPGEPMRTSSADRHGKFVFEDVPAGSYAVSLWAMPAEHHSSVSVTIVANESALVELVMPDVGIHLTIKTPTAAEADVVLAPYADNKPDIDRIRRPDASIGFVNERCYTFRYVQPGTYAISHDQRTWQVFQIQSSPPEQVVTIGTFWPEEP
jgi:hypothetical protein